MGKKNLIIPNPRPPLALSVEHTPMMVSGDNEGGEMISRTRADHTIIVLQQHKPIEISASLSFQTQLTTATEASQLQNFSS